jgi:hypothetical protein
VTERGKLGVGVRQRFGVVDDAALATRRIQRCVVGFINTGTAPATPPA